MGAFELGGLVSGLAGGILSGLFGIGGGIVLVPLLGLLLGLNQQQAQGVTLAVLLLPIGLPAVLAYRDRVTFRWWLVAALVVGFVAGVRGGAVLAINLDERPLRALFGALMGVAAALVWQRASPRARDEGAPRTRRSDWHGIWIGAGSGFMAGLFGIGGGIVMVPLLVMALGLEQHEAQATSLAVMLPPVGLPGVLVYARSQDSMPWGLMAMVAIGFAVGALGGARVAVRLRTDRLARGFAVLLFATAMRMAWSSFRP